MTAFLSRLWNDDRGQDMAEYAIMLGVIAAVVIGVIAALGTKISTIFSSITSAM